MHVAQVEHGLGAVLLLRRQPVVDDRRLVVHVGAVAVEVVVAQFDSRHGVTWKLKKEKKKNVSSFALQLPWKCCVPQMKAVQ